MYKLLLHRIPRELKANWVKYLIMTLIVTIALFTMVSFVISYDSMEILSLDTATTCKVEDGEFSLLLPMTDVEKEKLENKGVSVEEEFYIDVSTTSKEQDLRLFKTREDINTIQLVKGEIPSSNDEILIDKLFSTNQKINLSDTISIDNIEYKVSGIGVVPDYNFVYKDVAIAASASKNFGVAFLTSEGYNKAKEQSSATEIYSYAYRLNDSGLTDDDIKQFLIDEVDFDYKTVDDPYYQELIQRNTKEQQSLKDAVQALYDSFDSMSQGLNITKTMLDDSETLVKDYEDKQVVINENLEKFNINNTDSDLYKLNEVLKDKTSLTTEEESEVTTYTTNLKTAANNISTTFSSMYSLFSTAINQAKEVKTECEELEADAYTKTTSALNELINPETEYALTKENYAEILDDLITNGNYDETTLDQLNLMKSSLDSISGTTDCIDSYISTLKDARNSSSALSLFLSSQLSTTITTLNEIADFSESAKTIEEKQEEVDDIASDYNIYIQVFEKEESVISSYSSKYSQLTSTLNSTINTVNLLVKQIDKLNTSYGEALDKAKNAILNDLAIFLPQKENPRILTSYYRAIQYSTIIKTIGVVICFILAYILSVFATQQISQDTKNIGTLYSMGVTKKDLVLYYLTIPLLISFIGGVLGLLTSLLPIGITNTYRVMEIGGACVCEYQQVIKPYIYFFCLIGPALITFIVNLIVCNVKLNKKPTDLLNNVTNDKNGKDFNFIKKLSFTRAFQARVITRGVTTGCMAGFGVFACIVVLMIGLGINCFSNNAYQNTVNSLNYNYMTVYKYAPEEVPEGAEAHYMYSLKVTYNGSTNAVSLIGTTNDSKYYPKNIVTKGVNKITINRSFANKYGYDLNSPVILSDSTTNRDYIFYVANICDYEIGLTAFMEEESILELFDKKSGYYNMTLSDKEVNCEKGRIYSVVTKEQLINFAHNFIDQMQPIIITIISICFAIMILIMYILLGIMLDKNKYGISLLKVMGYNKKEIAKIYLHSNFFYILIAAIVSLPLGKIISDFIVKFSTKALPAGLDLTMPWYFYALVFASTILAYIICNFFLSKKMDKISLAEALKSRG